MKTDFYFSPGPRQMQHIQLDLAAGTCVATAVRQAMPDAPLHELTPAVWGRAVEYSYVLVPGDRLELLRPLRVDPMTARRERFAQQGINKAGLFKTRRKGAKAGY